MGRRLTTLIVAAHPDDEVLGAGIWIRRQSFAHPGNSAVHIVHITDGSPRDMQNARALGFRDRRSYARARRRELADALHMVSVPPGNCTQLGCIDKESYLHLPAIADQLDELIARIRPARVLSPAYEGGHPDHDAAAFAVAAVRRRRRSFAHWEFPLYHASPGGRMVTGNFIAGASVPETVLSLTREERLFKSNVLACFPTQREILSRFNLGRERFRRALAYDFLKPPHRGPLLYERWGWDITGADWRRCASEALSLNRRRSA